MVRPVRAVNSRAISELMSSQAAATPTFWPHFDEKAARTPPGVGITVHIGALEHAHGLLRAAHRGHHNQRRRCQYVQADSHHTGSARVRTRTAGTHARCTCDPHARVHATSRKKGNRARIKRTCLLRGVRDLAERHLPSVLKCLLHELPRHSDCHRHNVTF